MPLHDWTRVDPREYRDFHQTWLPLIKIALNSGVLPTGYFAATEYSSPPFIPDVLALEESDPDADLPLVPAEWPGLASPGPATAVAPVRPAETVGRERISVQDSAGRRLAAVIEVLSPSNKRRQVEFQDLLLKSVHLIDAGVGLLVVDLFPPRRHDPKGFHTAFWKELTQEPAGPPPRGKPLTAASYAPDGEGTCSAYVTPLAVGDVLPDAPLFLRPGLAVRVPLAATYEQAWAGYPQQFHRLVEDDPSPP